MPKFCCQLLVFILLLGVVSVNCAPNRNGKKSANSRNEEPDKTDIDLEETIAGPPDIDTSDPFMPTGEDDNIWDILSDFETRDDNMLDTWSDVEKYLDNLQDAFSKSFLLAKQEIAESLAAASKKGEPETSSKVEMVDGMQVVTNTSTWRNETDTSQTNIEASNTTATDDEGNIIAEAQTFIEESQTSGSVQDNSGNMSKPEMLRSLIEKMNKMLNEELEPLTSDKKTDINEEDGEDEKDDEDKKDKKDQEDNENDDEEKKDKDEEDEENEDVDDEEDKG